MNDRTGVIHRPRRAWPRAARTAAAIIATAGLALLAAACSGSPGSHVAQLGLSATQPGSSPGAPNAGGQKSGNFQTLAYSKCMRSHGEPEFPDPNAQGRIKQALRASGIDVNSSRYPDPGSDGREPDPASVGIDQNSPPWQSAHKACFQP
jgi:hypothetical protein